MINVTLIDPSGERHVITGVEAGVSLMEVARRSGVPGIAADCGGACSCATCHVYVGAAWREQVGPPDDIEFAMLDMVADVARDDSRLACQIRLNEALDGLVVTVAPAGAA